MESRPIKDRIADKRTNYVPIKLSDREVGVIEYVKEEMKFQSISQTIRELIIVGASKVQESKEIDPDIAAYIKTRQAKLATEFKSYGLTSVSVEHERIEEVEKLCEWHWMRDKSDVGMKAIVGIIYDARENLKRPDISDDIRKSLDKVLVDLKDRYMSRFAKEV